MKLEQMSVLLTGAAGGIGSATAAALFVAGARVLLVGRSPERLEALAASLRYSRRVGVLTADVTAPEGRRAIRDAAVSHGVNVLVNNAGLPCFGSLDSQDEEQIAHVVQTNLVAPILLTRLLLPHLQAQPEARVLNIGSALGSLGLPGFSVYGAAKFGLRGFSEALRRELQDSAVKVQYLAPRTTRTAFNDARVDAFNRATRTQSDSPDLVARAVLEMLERGRPERFLGFPERLAVRINGLAPSWLDAAFRRHRAALRSQHQSA